MFANVMNSLVHTGEVGGVGEKDDPLARVVGREVDLTLGRLCGECRGRVTDSRHVGYGGGHFDSGYLGSSS